MAQKLKMCRKNKATESTLRPPAVYTLGKIHSKYLILNLMGFSNTQSFVKNLMYSSSIMTRRLVVKNYALL